MTALDIVVRDIDGQAEIRAVEELQKEVWGLPDLDVVPLTQLVAAKASGGALIGAFDNKKLIGFAYGFAGFEHGRATHHSHMLAVNPAYRNHSVGYRLKRAQRDRVLAHGISEMTWTFDPLQSMNAYFNFNRLGVVSDRYLIDFYGSDAPSFLHRNGTDRLWVTWQLASRHVVERLEGSVNDPVSEARKALVEVDDHGSPLLCDFDLTNAGDQVSIEIPSEIGLIEEQDRKIASAWRKATRTAFSTAFSAGYSAIEFIRGHRAGRYVLRRQIAGGGFM
ncbi:MAG: GNAT family N-acetyltransferase [Acidobacteriota bacterium]